MKLFKNLEIKTTSHSYWKVQLICKKFQIQSSLEPPLEHNQDQMSLTNQSLLWPYQPHLEL